MDFLFNEHSVLLRAAEVTRIVNRLILVGFVLLEVLYGAQSIGTTIALVAAGVVATIYWSLQAFLFRRNIDRLEELVVQAFAESFRTPEHEINRPILTSPAEHERLYATSKTTQQSAQDAWVSAYVNWRHERWKYSGFEAAESLEPLVWFVLLAAFAAVHFLRR
jgi:hypothetical protein